MNQRKARRAYKRQKFHAKGRGIRFYFTFEEWIKWWEDNAGLDWQERRGPSKHQLCMARLGDRGSYRLGNVKCITHLQNRMEQITPTQSEKSCWAKLTREQAAYIKKCKERSILLAQRFGVNRTTITRIRCGDTWKI